MPTGKCSSFDGPKWQVDPSTTASRRRETTTSFDTKSSNNRTYLDATSPQTENKTKMDTPKDPSVLTLLACCKSKGTGIMLLLKEENKSVSKANDGEDDKEILYNELEHALCRLVYKIFLQQEITDWDKFVSTNREEFDTYGFLAPALRMFDQLF